jgi:hypothetical protein
MDRGGEQWNRRSVTPRRSPQRYCTVIKTLVEVVIFELAESVPVTVKVYLPEVVAGVAGLTVEVVVERPPQPMVPAKITTNSTIMESHRRLRAGMPNIRRAAKAAPPPLNRQRSWPNGVREDVVEAAVVFTVRTLFPLPPDAMVTLAGLRLQVGTLCAPEGEPVKAQLRFMVPEYVLPAVMVAVAVALAPAETGEGAGAVTTAWETVTVVVAFIPANIPSPE